jgi:hypothetical protein
MIHVERQNKSLRKSSYALCKAVTNFNRMKASVYHIKLSLSPSLRHAEIMEHSHRTMIYPTADAA